MNHITSEIVQAYALCPRKAFLLLCVDGGATSPPPHEYVRILEAHARANRAKHLSLLQQQSKSVQAYSSETLKEGDDYLLDGSMKSGDLQAHCDVLQRVRATSGLGRHSYEPTLIAGTYSITREQKTALTFVGYVLGQIQGRSPASGTILSQGGQAHGVHLGDKYKTIKNIVETLRHWTAGPRPEQPPVILNRHCPYCPFRKECADKAHNEDHLSLLDRMTPKLIKKYEQKGIFTVKQLSHLFRPRRSRKKTPCIRFKPELQALAIRTNKIYLQQPQSRPRAAVEIFLDIEGMPDEGFNYLIGLLISNGQPLTYKSFWADRKENEPEMWNAFLSAIGQHPDAPIYHYGRYETKAVETFAQRHGGDAELLKKRLINVNSWIFGRVYFPVRSNNLKELGKHLGARWTSPDASGLQSLVWRHRWEETADENLKRQLLTYHEEDCRALHLLVDTVSKLKDDAASCPEVELADRPKRHATQVGKEIHGQFDWICKSAQADYDRNKINLRPAEDSDGVVRKLGAPKGHQAYQRLIPRMVGKVIRVRPRKKCPRHHELLQPREDVAEKTIIDLVFTKNGCRKTTTRYGGAKGFCQRCKRDYLPPGIVKLGNHLIGHGFRAWTIHQKIVLRLPYRIITDVMEDMFGERVSQSSIVNFMTSFAKEYAGTERMLVERILQSPFVHVDETRLNIQGTDHYVWVFTDGMHVVFRMTETRETTVVREFLKGYTGVLISDFYPGYDSIECPQQKCLVHLIRDLNEDLWSNPFNSEFESFVLDVRNLLVPMLEAVDKYGLKTRHLRRFKKCVVRFYKRSITNKTYQSEITITYQKRFQRYRESLFVFLEHDNIPWNNNMAERAIRELAVQRKISGTFFKRASSPYLLLLGIAQSCRFQEKSFLKFLLSREKDVDAFRSEKRKKISIPVGPQRCVAEQSLLIG